MSIKKDLSIYFEYMFMKTTGYYKESYSEEIKNKYVGHM